MIPTVHSSGANSLRSHGLSAPRPRELETPQSSVVGLRSLLPGCAWGSWVGNDSSKIPRGQVELTLDPMCLLRLPRATRAEFFPHAFLQPLVSALGEPVHSGKESGQGSSPGSASETSSPHTGRRDPRHWPLHLSPRLPYAAEGPGGVAQGLVGANRTQLRSSLGCQSPSLLWKLKDNPSPSAQSC